jgi:predicted dehydrogenase
MTRPQAVSRRTFLLSSAAGVAAATLGVRQVRAAANDRIALGFIGVGTMGRGHLGAFLGMADVQVVAVCDVAAVRRDDAKKRVEDHYAKEKGRDFKGCEAYVDFRELLQRKDIDAVVIATPDHWHAIPCVQAARAGKHIYCEKPLTHNVAEGRRIVEEVAKAGITFQTGSQQRSEFGGKFRQAVELVRNGRVGKIKTVRIGVGGPARPCDLAAEELPEGIDWDRWLGPAPKRGYSHVLCPKIVHNHFPAWRDFQEYAGGGLADMGAHHFDIAQWALDMDGSGPVKVEPPQGKETSGLRFTYASGVEMFHGGPADCTFEGSEGVLMVGRGKIESNPKKILEEPLGEGAVRVYHATDHRRNWIECLKAKKPTICPAEVGHRSATICHLGNIGYRLRRPLRWDPAQEKFLGDDEANKLLSREMRAPWTL